MKMSIEGKSGRKERYPVRERRKEEIVGLEAWDEWSKCVQLLVSRERKGPEQGVNSVAYKAI